MIESVTSQIAAARKELDKLSAASRIAEDDRRRAGALASPMSMGGPSAPAKNPDFDYEAMNKKRAQALQIMNGLEKSASDARFATREQEANQILNHGDRLAALDVLANDRRTQIDLEFEAKKKALRDQNALDHVLSDQQLAAAQVQIEEEKRQKIKGILDASAIDFMNNKKTLNDALYSTFKSGITNSIASFAGALAKGEDAFGAFAKGFLGMLGDMAIQLGSTLLFAGDGMQSLFAFQPAGAIAAGIGLIAIGGILKAFASSGGPQGGGGGVASSPSNAGGAITENPSLEDKKAQTSVIVNVQGNILDRKEAGLELIEIMNEHFSANDGRLVRAV
jgi:hypothetical protein